MSPRPRIAFAQPASLDDPLRMRFRAIRQELHVREEFPPEVLAEASRASSAALEGATSDLTDLPFLTIDPPGSMDLDQAMCLERAGAGYRVRYAIADVPAFVTPGGAIDAEARVRGVTIYCPDARLGLHPPALAENAASLLPDQVRSAFVWDIQLDADANTTAVHLRRARVRSRARITYTDVQAATAPSAVVDQLVLLREIGERRIAREQARGGSSLQMPEQEVIPTSDGGYALSVRPVVPSEDWNAQISLLTGMAAAEIMLAARVGILRTMPAPEAKDVERLRRQARALAVPWPDDLTYGAFLKSLSADDPHHLAVIQSAGRLFRGAGYTAFDGSPPPDPSHAAVAAPYAHVTAPLRRLVDRFGLVACEALANGRDVPGWVRDALPTLPKIMAAADHQANAVERACVDAVEAAVLASRAGQLLDATVVDEDPETPLVHVHEPPIVARATGVAAAGQEVQVIVTQADVTRGTVGLQIVR